MSKFDSKRDELFYVMTLEGWANASSGNVECPTGFFARISNSAQEIEEIRQAFTEETRAVSDDEIIGHYLCTENDLGFWYVEEFPTESALISRYEQLERIYSEWDTE